MNDEFRRLLDDAPGAELRLVLESGLRDQPTPRTLGRAAKALGVGAPGLRAARAAVAAGGGRALRTSSWTALAKWGAAGALLGGVALSPVLLNAPAVPLSNVAQRTTPRARAGEPNENLVFAVPPTNTPEPTAFAPPSSAPRSAAGSAVPPPRSKAMPIVTSAPSEAVQPPKRLPQALASSVSTTPAFATPSDLDEEVALMDSTRTALRHHDPNTALTLLDRHARLNTRSLAAEATLLRVQALVLAGRAAEARAIARTALAGTIESPYAARLRKLAGLLE